MNLRFASLVTGVALLSGCGGRALVPGGDSVDSSAGDDVAVSRDGAMAEGGSGTAYDATADAASDASVQPVDAPEDASTIALNDAFADASAVANPDAAPSCSLRATRCSGNGVQTCGSNGLWSDTTDCVSQTCIAGVCQGVCAPGDSVCDNGAGQTCDSTGHFTAPVACPYACLYGTCTGNCVPGARRCAGSGRQVCSNRGEWSPVAQCPCGICGSSGICICVLCTAGDTRCSGGIQQTCNAGGSWISDCDGGCDGGTACASDAGSD